VKRLGAAGFLTATGADDEAAALPFCLGLARGVELEAAGGGGGGLEKRAFFAGGLAVGAAVAGAV